MKKRLMLIPLLILLISSLTSVVFAHSGKTDGKGGHYDYSTGEYHYHHGYSAHDHYDMDGDGKKDCPYEFDNKTNHSNNTSNSGTTSNNTSNNTNNSKPMLKLSFGDVVIIILKIIGKSLWFLISGFYVWGMVFSLLTWLMYLVCEKILKKDTNSFVPIIISIVIVVVADIVVASIVVLSSERLL